MLSSTIRSASTALSRQVARRSSNLASSVKFAAPSLRRNGTGALSSLTSSSLQPRFFSNQSTSGHHDKSTSSQSGGIGDKIKSMASKLDPTGSAQNTSSEAGNYSNGDQANSSSSSSSSSSRRSESPHERAERMNSEYGLKNLNEGEQVNHRSSHGGKGLTHRRHGSRRGNSLMSRDSDLFDLSPFGFHLSPRGLFAMPPTFGPPSTFDDVFARVFDDSPFDKMMSKMDSTIAPITLDVAQTPTSYEISAQVPGLSKDDIHVKIEQDDGRQYLLIRGERKQESRNDPDHDDSKRHVYVESSYGLTERRMLIPNDANINSSKDIHGKLENGVLKLTIPRDENAKEDHDDGTVKIE